VNAAPADQRLRLADLLGSLAVLGAAAVFFRKFFEGESFSAVQMYQDAVYPWAAHSRGLAFFPQSDQAALSYPWQALYQRALQGFEPAFWDPYSFLFGYPFEANGSSAAFSPLRLLSTLLTRDPQHAHDVFSFLCVFASGIAAYACARSFGERPWGALFGALSWMFCGWNLSWLHLEVVAPLSFELPLTVLCIHNAVARQRFSWAVAGALSVALTLVSGHALLLGIVCLVGAVQVSILVAVKAARRDFRGMRVAGFHGALIFVFGIVLAAFVLVPTAINLSSSQRQAFSYAELQKTWLGKWQSFTLRALVAPPLPITEEHMHQMGFVGTCAAALSIWGALRKWRGRWTGILLWAIPGLVAIGTPLTWLAYHLIPAFDIFRPYSRLVFISSFGLCLLAGAGLDGLLSQPWMRPRVAPVVALLILFVNTRQLVKYGHAVNPPLVPADVPAYPEMPSLAVLRAFAHSSPTGWPARILPVQVNDAEGSFRPVLFGDFGPVLGLVMASGYDSAVPRRTVAVLRLLQGVPLSEVLGAGLPSAYSPTFPSGSLPAQMLPRLGVELVLAGPTVSERELWSDSWVRLPKESEYAGPDGRVFHIAGADSGPYVASHPVVTAGEAQALERLVRGPFQRGDDVLLEAGELEVAGEPARPCACKSGAATLTRMTVNTVRLSVSTPAPGFLVVPVAYSAGWIAEVNGRRAPTLHANYVELATPIPAGRSEVRLEFRPPGYIAGAAVSGCGVIILGAALVVFRNRRRRGDSPPRP
jgi:Bacterial membrane protein YfhO